MVQPSRSSASIILAHPGHCASKGGLRKHIMGTGYQIHHQVTPPESLISSPPSPPPTDERLAQGVARLTTRIAHIQSGLWPWCETWSLSELGSDAFAELSRQFGKDEGLGRFAKQKLRYETFPSLNLFVIRMPTVLREIFIGGVVAELKQQLGDVKGEAASFADKILSCGSASIHPRDNTYGRHDPDGQFRYSDAPYPGVVIEVSYAQKRKHLSTIAEVFILGSDSLPLSYFSRSVSNDYIPC